MGVAFPPGRGPAWHAQPAPSVYKGMFPVGTAPTFTLSNSTLPTAYTVRDYSGTIVSTGAVSGTTLIPAAPTGGWTCGWYRLYLTGANSDATFGTAYGDYSFAVIRVNTNFVAPPAAGTSWVIVDDNTAYDLYTRGVAVVGPQRWKIQDVTNLALAPSLTSVQAAIAIEKTYYSANGHLDSARPRPTILSFANGAVDSLTLLDGNSNITWVVYAKDGTVDGSTTFVQVSAGTAASTAKIQVFSPNSTTLVETFDNIVQSVSGMASIVSSRTSTSSYIRVAERGRFTIAAPHAVTAIGNAKATGTKSVVTAVYPDITWFEGPINEPDQNGWGAAETAQAMHVFHDTIKAANAAANVLGPNPVSAGLAYAATGQWWDLFLGAGGGAYCDGISFHAYNMELGDLAMARANLTQLKTMLTKYGQQNKPLWQTEQGVFTSVYGVYHPRRARWTMLQFLVQEQFGIPKEQNHLWYDEQTGFWGQPAQWSNGLGGVNPQAALIRTFSEEVFGRTLETALDFGTPGNAMYLGSVYRNATDNTRVVVVMCPSPISGAQVTFTVTGATGPTLTTSDGWGNTATVPITAGKATLPASDIPTYLRLPAGATVTVTSYGSWPAKSSARLGENLAITGVASQSASSGNPTHLANGIYENGYDNTLDPTTNAPTLPGWLQLYWPQGARFDRVCIWSGPCWQSKASLTDFDVQTSTNGTTWTTQATITNTPPATVNFVSNDQSTGCTYETFWDERWIFDVKLPSVVQANYLRINARAASYGGEPDATCLAAGGQGGNPLIVAQEIGVYNSEFATSQPVAVLAS